MIYMFIVNIALDNVILLIIWTMPELMKCLKLFDYQDSPLKERQLHYTSVLSLLRTDSTPRRGGEDRRSDREGH